MFWKDDEFWPAWNRSGLLSITPASIFLNPASPVFCYSRCHKNSLHFVVLLKISPTIISCIFTIIIIYPKCDTFRCSNLFNIITYLNTTLYKRVNCLLFFLTIFFFLNIIYSLNIIQNATTSYLSIYAHKQIPLFQVVFVKNL